MSTDLNVICTLFVAGAVGGLVRAIVECANTENTLTMPFVKTTISLGFMGDLLIGGSASIVAYTFFNVFGMPTTNSSTVSF